MVSDMSALPPSETPALRTFHLAEGAVVPHPSLQPPTSSRRFSFPRFAFSVPSQLSQLPFSRGTALALAFLVLPVGVAIALQPQTPKLSAAAQDETQQLLAQQKSENENLVASLDPTLPTTSNSSDADLTEAELVAANDAAKSFNYYLTLSKGFLNKAVELSRSTSGSGTQSEEDKSEILANLEKALDNVNTAIDLDSRQGSAFLLRARIYKTASVIRPELSEKAEQDLQIARALGVNDEALNSNDNPLDYVPTQQADSGTGAIVADAEEGSDANVQTETTSNALSGKATLQPGSDMVYVPFPGLTSDMQLSVTASAESSQEARGLSFSIQSRKDGKGFTIQSSQQVEHNISLDWKATELLQ
jgi:hypothetical protein